MNGKQWGGDAHHNVLVRSTVQKMSFCPGAKSVLGHIGDREEMRVHSVSPWLEGGANSIC